MYRAIVCIEQGHGALIGPSPVFCTEEACEEYWLSRWYNAGPQINSFRAVKVGKNIENTPETKNALVGKMMKMQCRLNGLEYEEALEMLDGFVNKPLWIVDCQIAVLQEKLWEKKMKCKL